MKWIKCTDESFPDLNNRFVLIRYRDDSKKFKYHLYNDCPYGWNVLEKKDAEFITLRIS